MTSDIYVRYTYVTMADNISFELPDIESYVNETDTFAFNNISICFKNCKYFTDNELINYHLNLSRSLHFLP